MSSRDDVGGAGASEAVSVADVFSTYVEWLRVNAPAAYANLAPAASDAEIEALEAVIGRDLPANVRAVLSVHNGQRLTMTATRPVPAVPTIPTLTFLSTELIAECWLEWEGVRQEPGLEELQEVGDVFPSAVGRVKPIYTSAGWIPLWADPRGADFIGLDLDPDAGGVVGQVINFGREEEKHYICASSLSDLLGFLLDEVKSGRWPATEIGYGDGFLPWLGSPGSHFFNALHQRSLA